MPVPSISTMTTRAENRGASKRPVKVEKPKAQRLQLISQQETKSWKDALDDPSIIEYNFYNLDDPFEYPFKDQDSVWVRTKGNHWMLGRVSGRVIRVGQTRHRKQGFFYPVHFGTKQNLRKYFAPTNGEIKPDNEDIRDLLRDGGWIDSDDLSISDSGSTYTE